MKQKVGVNHLQSKLEQVAQKLLLESMHCPWGKLSPSVYDTAYSLFLPSEIRPKESLEFILSNQNDNGSWGTPDTYCIVPTLAATAGLFHLTLKAACSEEIFKEQNRDRIALAALNGLSFLRDILNQTTSFPDTVAVELIIPALVEKIETTLTAIADLKEELIDQTELFGQYIRECLDITLPPQDMKLLTKLRMAVSLGEYVPMKLFHTLEVFGNDLDNINDLDDVDGLYGASPASTIAMLNALKTPKQDLIFSLSEIASNYNGTYPVAIIPIFERVWVLYNLILAGISIPDDMSGKARDYIKSFLGSEGIGFAPKMSPDSDTTSVALYVLNKLGDSIEPVSLLAYETETHFLCYEGERTPSASTNAHILQAFGNYIKLHPEHILDYKRAIAKISTYLLSVQNKDGSWIDKWHASPYYATSCSVLALHSFGKGDTTEAVERAIAWFLHTQRKDGSWGIWQSTLDETACAVQMLLLTECSKYNKEIEWAADQGQNFLRTHKDAPTTHSVRMRLWHEKDLFEPVRIVDSEVLSALYLCETAMNVSQEFSTGLT